MSSNKNLKEFFAKVNCNNDESVEDCLHRQLQDEQSKRGKLKIKYELQRRQYKILKKSFDELLKEKHETKAEIQCLENKLKTYLEIQKSFEQKIKAEILEIKIPKKSNGNDPNDEICFLGSFPSRVCKRPSNDDSPNFPQQKRRTMEDRSNDLSIEDHQSVSSSSHFPTTR